VRSKVVVYMGREKAGVTELFAHMYFSDPVPGATVATIKLTRLPSGPYGTEMSMSFPKIASGAGSITSLVLHIGKGIGFRGTMHSVIGARCPDGHLDSAARFVFADGTEAGETASSPCGRRAATSPTPSE
jgi:hypothetical protein